MLAIGVCMYVYMHVCMYVCMYSPMQTRPKCQEPSRP